MSDDGLDPAFAEFDLETTGHIEGRGGLFESEDDDDSFNHDQHSPNSLGFELETDQDYQGDGSLGNELGGLQGESEEEDDRRGLPHGSYSPPSTNTFFDHDNGGSRSSMSTPRRRTATGREGGGGNTPNGGGNQRMSLAFELAVMEPTSASRELMRELGIDEDEGETSGGDAETLRRGRESDEEDNFEHKGSTLGEPLFAQSTSNRGNGTSPRNNHSRNGSTFGSMRLRTKASTNSLRPSFPDFDQPLPSLNEEDTDTTFREMSSRLQESMESTDEFLRRLRQHIHSDIDTSSHSLPIPPSSITETNGSSSNSTPSSPSNPVDSNSVSIDYTDRQPIVEKISSTYLKQLYQFSRQRESQSRELTDIERTFARNEVNWRGILEEMEPLPKEFYNEIVDERTTEEVEDDDSPSNDIDLRTRRSSQPDLSKHRIIDDFSQLRNLTSTLLSTLSSLTDIVQVQSALISDSNRRMKALRTQAVAVEEESNNLEKSREFIERFESPGGGKGRLYRSEAKEVMKGVEGMLEEAEKRAKSILSV